MYTPIEMNRSMKYGSTYLEGFSPKIDRIVKFFSQLEYDNWTHIEVNPKIVSFCEQPLKVDGYFEGEYIDSIPDMWVKYEDGSEELIEVKYIKDLYGDSEESLRAIRQIEVQRQWCKKNNLMFSVKTEEEIRKDLIYLNNLKQIIGNVRWIGQVNHKDLDYIIQLLTSKNLTVADIKNYTNFTTAYVIQMLSWLIYKGKCQLINPNLYLSLKTEVSLVVEK